MIWYDSFPYLSCFPKFQIHLLLDAWNLSKSIIFFLVALNSFRFCLLLVVLFKESNNQAITIILHGMRMENRTASGLLSSGGWFTVQSQHRSDQRMRSLVNQRYRLQTRLSMSTQFWLLLPPMIIWSIITITFSLRPNIKFSKLLIVVNLTTDYLKLSAYIWLVQYVQPGNQFPNGFVSLCFKPCFPHHLQ